MQTIIDTLDHERVRAAVRRAEERTAGEIVPVVVPQSDAYEIATWRGAVLGGLLALVGVLLVLQFYSGWGLSWLYTPWGVALVVLGAGVVAGGLATVVRPLRRAAAGNDLLDETVHRRALQAFVEEEVFATQDRTGILIFVSLLEHRVEVLGDAGINRHVDPEDWGAVVDRIREGIRNDQFTKGLEEAVQMCGRLLERRGVEVQPDDENELSNTVRTPASDPESSDE